MAVDPLPVVSPFAPSADGTSGTSLSVAAWFGIIIGGVVLLGIFYGLWQRYKYNKSRNIAGRRDDKPPMGVHDQLLDQHEQNKIAAASASDQPFGDPGRDFPPVVLSDEQESPSAAHRSASSTVDSRLSDDDRTEEIARRNNPFNSSSRTGDPIIARGFATRIAGPQFSDNPEDLRPMVD
jgi:deferrochelatase/peroxidase EfeB